MTNLHFKPGFRLSFFDVMILAVGLIGAWLLRTIALDVSYILIFVVGHFFYFCNITRMSRISELIWAVCFVALVGVGVTYAIVTLYEAFAIAVTITVLLTVLELYKPSYHGVFWSTFNPNLQAWFESQNA